MEMLSIQQMQYDFQQKLLQQKVNQKFTSYDIVNFLNEAQTKIIEELSDEFEKTEKARTYLFPLINVSEILPNVPHGGGSYIPIHPNGISFILPTDYYRTLKEEAVTVSGVRVKVKPQKHDYYNSNIDNPFKKPSPNLFWRIDIGTTGTAIKVHEIITDGTQLSNYILTYLMTPTTMSIEDNISCILHSSIHHNIVDVAVGLAISSIEKSRFIAGEADKTKELIINRK